MSGPYDKQVLTQTVGRTGGLSAGQVGGQAGGVTVGQAGGSAAGQFGGQGLGQTVTQTSTTQRSAESFQTQQAAPAVARQRRQRNETSSSNSSSDRAYRAGAGAGAGGQATSASYQQYSAENQFVQGGSAAVGYAAAGDSFGSVASGPRRQGRHQKQVIRLPDQQGQVRQVRRRLPTPEPDTFERVYIQRAGNEVIEEITEVPTTPPPRVQERTVVEPAGPPQVIKRVVRVAPRSGGYQQQGASFSSNLGQSSGNLLSAGSYGNVQQATDSYQQYGVGAATTGFSGFGSVAPATASVGAGYGSFGAGYGSVGAGYGSAGAGYGSVGAGYGSAGAGYGSAGAGYGSVGAGYGSAGAGYGSAGAGYGSVGGGYQQGFGGYPTQVAGPFPGIPPNATCFYA